MKRVIFTLILACVIVVSHGQLRLPVIFDDHMVLQRQSSVPVWGWASPSQEIRISVSWDTAVYKTKADNTTFWKTAIRTPVAGGPHTITIKAGGEERTLTDVLSGEVWLCSGQSNMEWSMEASADGKAAIGQVNDPMIRLFHVPKSSSASLQVRGEGDWKVCDAATVRYFSAVAYFFGKTVNRELGVPIGLINASWGGTPAEVWLPKENVEAVPELKASAGKQALDRPWCPGKPGEVFNAMVNPIIPFRIAGALWYQGESNSVAPSTYALLMENLILEWRRQFQSALPFYYVQIAPYSNYASHEFGILLREQQTKMLSIPKTGMVVISDLVDNVKDIHPRYKKPVGERLAAVALADTYGRKGITYQSPLYTSMKVEKSKVRIFFDHVPSGLMVKGKEPVEFTIAGEDKKFYPAQAKVDGKTVVVWAKEVKKPVAVRFGWSNGSIPNLFSKEELPVGPFRTDEWMD
jgi:sialate O-acetylesterase